MSMIVIFKHNPTLTRSFYPQNGPLCEDKFGLRQSNPHAIVLGGMLWLLTRAKIAFTFFLTSYSVSFSGAGIISVNGYCDFPEIK